MKPRADADTHCLCGKRLGNPNADHQWFCTENKKKTKREKK